jgi:hypothetical protein
MPCSSEHLEPTAREAESVRVLELLREIEGQTFDHDNPHYAPYGHPDRLDLDTARLCLLCREDSDIASRSLELQLWWRRHKAADKQKADAQRERLRVAHLRFSARAKLTPEERRAVGLE